MGTQCARGRKCNKCTKQNSKLTKHGFKLKSGHQSKVLDSQWMDDMDMDISKAAYQGYHAAVLYHGRRQAIKNTNKLEKFFTKTVVGRQLHWWRTPCQTVLKGGWVSIQKDTKSNTLIKSQRQHPPGQTSRINRQKGQKNGHACVETKMPD